MSAPDRGAMLDQALSVRRQCALVGVARSLLGAKAGQRQSVALIRRSTNCSPRDPFSARAG